MEATEFPDLARRFNVYAVPKIVINDAHEFVGALPEQAFVAAVARALAGEGGPADSGDRGDGEATPLEGPTARPDPGDVSS